MTAVIQRPYTDTQRMELRGVARVASEAIGQYWPMRMFVHHNPLHGLEHLPFETAVRHAEAFLGGRGYLPNDIYRAYVRSGRISTRDLDEALRPLATEVPIAVGGRLLAHHEVLRAHLVHGVPPPAEDVLEARIRSHVHGGVIDALADRMKTVPIATQTDTHAVSDGAGLLGRAETLSAWCDRTLGSRIVEQINNEMIKWCAAYLDEGHAAWAMAEREHDFYGAWRRLAVHEWSACGIPDIAAKVGALPELPEDALLDSCAALGIPSTLWQDYLTLQLAALPGWAAFIRWRGDQGDYRWQQAHPTGLIKYLAVRLWYERELVEQACRQHLGLAGSLSAISEHAARAAAGREIPTERTRPRVAAWRLVSLAQSLALDPRTLSEAPAETLATLLRWLDALPETAQGPVWLRAFEAGYQERLLGELGRQPGMRARGAMAERPRPDGQAVFCIDVRSEPFRRHLEAVGRFETFGFAGFFAVFIRYQAWGHFHETDQFPVIMKAKNAVREIPRTYVDQALALHVSRERLIRAGYTLLHDLKENVVTPYVMVESIGWFFGIPFFLKTFIPNVYKKVTTRLRRLFVPPIATTLMVEKPPRTAVEDLVASEQRATIRRALHERFGKKSQLLSDEVVEALRLRALNGNGSAGNGPEGRSLAGLNITPEAEAAFVLELGRRYRIEPRWASRQKERVTRTGFTLDEQAVTVETALRMMGLTSGFARLVLICGHGSLSDNNPFEAALDCGACGGNEGKPNARVLAMMANRRPVRERIAKNGLTIPADTHFLAGQVNTTTDEVELYDLEDVPDTYRDDIERLRAALREAGRRTAQERLARLPDIAKTLSPAHAAASVKRRSSDWSQVRPEWGLSGNAAFIIGRRDLTREMNLQGRVFLHSYDYREDPAGRLLEVLMTAPQMVAQWINMEHYFSTVDNDVYGAGSKIYHNVVDRIGIMTGPNSDLRVGLAWQTVWNGEMPYHEPMRLLSVIEAPRTRIEELIRKHELLQRYYQNGWVHLVAVEREEAALYRYLGPGSWQRVSGDGTLSEAPATERAPVAT